MSKYCKNKVGGKCQFLKPQFFLQCLIKANAMPYLNAEAIFGVWFVLFQKQTHLPPPLSVDSKIFKLKFCRFSNLKTIIFNFVDSEIQKLRVDLACANSSIEQQQPKSKIPATGI